ncbi:MAG: EamA family transporter [bacterium]|nr:EamA family transporter [bacterium]
MRATGAGAIAILIWASLSLLTVWSGKIPPFQLVAMSFLIATLLGLAMILIEGLNPRLWRLNGRAMLLGVAGLFGYHFFFFFALRHAPALEASLVNYLWPLLIVLFSALLPAAHQQSGLRWWHITGALLGFSGAILILFVDAEKGAGSFAGQNWIGYLAALVAALVWSTYSVASRLFANVPTQAVTIYCFFTMIGATFAHLMFEPTIWPASMSAWLAVLLLGLGPVGGAFYFWDAGMKRGDVRLLGVLSYFVPLLSMLLLITAGISSPDPLIWVAAALIISGAVLAARDKLFRASTPHRKS